MHTQCSGLPGPSSTCVCLLSAAAYCCLLLPAAGTKLGQQFSLLPVLQQLKSMLDDLYRLVDSTPPVQQSLRYGNPAFRTWFAAMTEQAPGMMQQVRLRCVWGGGGRMGRVCG